MAAGIHCATRYSQEISAAYNKLSASSKLPLYADTGDYVKNKMPWFTSNDAEMFRCLVMELRNLRQDAFTKLYGQFLEEHHGADTAHLRKKLIYFLGKERGIPRYENSMYVDVFKQYGGHFTQERALSEFDKLYNLKTVVSALKEKFDMSKCNMHPTNILIDYYKAHLPQGKDPSLAICDLFGLDPESCLPVDGGDGKVQETFLIQILKQLCLISKKTQTSADQTNVN